MNRGKIVMGFRHSGYLYEQCECPISGSRGLVVYTVKPVYCRHSNHLDNTTIFYTPQTSCAQLVLAASYDYYSQIR